MSWFNDLSLMKKIIFGFMSVALLTVIVGIIGAINISKMADADSVMYNKATVPIVYAGQISREYQRVRVYLRDILRTNDVAVIKKTKENLLKTDADIRDNIKKILEIAKGSNAEIEVKVATLTDAYQELFELVMRIERFSEDGNVKVVNELMTAQSTIATLTKIDNAVNDIFNSHEQLAYHISQKNSETAKYSSRFMMISIGVAFFMALLLGFAIALSIKRPIYKGLLFAKKIATGDFTERLAVHQKDEIGELAGALNTAAVDLDKMVADIILNSRTLVQSIQEISAGNENLSQRTSEQASSLEEIASTLEETSASIIQNADNSKRADDIAAKTLIVAENGGRVVGEAVSAINEISEESIKIEAITTVISEIAFQTNLLALNAAVEAARAGEQGRGFAVVAGEVRNLAQRSAVAVKEIGELVKSTLNKVEKGTRLANGSGDSLVEIIASVKEVGRFVSEIAAASDEQRQGSSQINIAISELDTMTQQNAGLVEENASASEEIAGRAQELLRMMDKFKINETIV
jgi:methyl-accepting chemotaxis protein